MSFEHEALIYAGPDEFRTMTAALVREGVAAGRPTLAILPADKLEALRDELGAAATGVEFAEMDEVGANPARLIPAWREWVDRNAAPGTALLGIGEPAHCYRRDAELAECHQHESLLNLAFAGTRDFQLVCPYDTEALDPNVIEGARRNHPILRMGDATHDSALYRGHERAAEVLGEPLPEPVGVRHALPFVDSTLPALRQLVALHAARAGLAAEVKDDVTLAVNEVATNSIAHGGGHGVLRIWRDEGWLVFEVRDRGRIDDPLVGRGAPDPGRTSGYGLWLANQVCELVQVRSSDRGTVVRMHVRVA